MRATAAGLDHIGAADLAASAPLFSLRRWPLFRPGLFTPPASRSAGQHGSRVCERHFVSAADLPVAYLTLPHPVGALCAPPGRQRAPSAAPSKSRPEWRLFRVGSLHPKERLLSGREGGGWPAAPLHRRPIHHARLAASRRRPWPRASARPKGRANEPFEGCCVRTDDGRQRDDHFVLARGRRANSSGGSSFCSGWPPRVDPQGSAPARLAGRPARPTDRLRPNWPCARPPSSNCQVPSFGPLSPAGRPAAVPLFTSANSLARSLALHCDPRTSWPALCIVRAREREYI